MSYLPEVLDFSVLLLRYVLDGSSVLLIPRFSCLHYPGVQKSHGRSRTSLMSSMTGHEIRSFVVEDRETGFSRLLRLVAPNLSSLVSSPSPRTLIHPRSPSFWFQDHLFQDSTSLLTLLTYPSVSSTRLRRSSLFPCLLPYFYPSDPPTVLVGHLFVV